MLSDAMEDYLKAIYELQRERGPPVRTSALADHLGVTPPTVTTMAGKLADRGLVEREKYRGVELTADGETVAIEVLRHHRLLEAFLADHLDYEWDRVHAEADTLEHHISEEFERRLATALGDPTVDPHGDPIPSADLEPPAEDDATALTTRDEGDRVVVSRVNDSDEDHLRYLAAAGVEPGTELELVEKTPVDVVVVAVGDETVHLPEDVATTIRVDPARTTAGEP